MKKVLSILVVVLALTLALGCFAFADEFGGAGYEEAAFGYSLYSGLVQGALAQNPSNDFYCDNIAADYTAPTCAVGGQIRVRAQKAGVDIVTVNGVTEKSVVGRYYTVGIDPTGNHIYSAVVVDKENNCKEEGLAHHACEVCGKSLNDVIKLPKDATKHVFGDWIHEIAPTCTQKGRDVRLCNFCGEREEKPIAATGHAKKAEFIFSKTLKEAKSCNHSILSDAGEQLWVCPKCNGKEDPANSQEVRKYWLEHSWGSLRVVTPADCLTDGTGTHLCYKCYADKATIDEDSDGNPDYGYEVIKAPGHVFVLTAANKKGPDAPTCTKDSYYYYNCVGHADSPKDKFGTALYKTDCPKKTAVPTWVMIDGNPDYSQNKEEHIVYVYVPALGHDFGEWKCVTAPGQSGNNNGYWTRTCQRIGCTAIEDFTGTQAEFDAMIAGKEAEEHAKLKNGLLPEDGEWKYYVDDVFQSDFNGVVEQDGNDFFVADGKVCMDANGLNMYDGEWYFLSLGRVCAEHTGLALYDGCWFFITNGKLDTSVTGLVDYNGGTFVFADGRLVAEYSGLYFDGTDWYFAANGQIQKDFTGSVEYNGETFVLENGKLVG